MIIILFIFLTTVFASSDEKYIELLPEEEKQEFLEKIARRIMENIQSKENKERFSRELSDDQLKEHNEFVESILLQEREQMRSKGDDISKGDSSGHTVESDANSENIVKRQRRSYDNEDTTQEQSAENDKAVTEKSKTENRSNNSDEDAEKVKPVTEISSVERIKTEANNEQEDSSELSINKKLESQTSLEKSSATVNNEQEDDLSTNIKGKSQTEMSSEEKSSKVEATTHNLHNSDDSEDDEKVKPLIQKSLEESITTEAKKETEDLNDKEIKPLSEISLEENSSTAKLNKEDLMTNRKQLEEIKENPGYLLVEAKGTNKPEVKEFGKVKSETKTMELNTDSHKTIEDTDSIEKEVIPLNTKANLEIKSNYNLRNTTDSETQTNDTEIQEILSKTNETDEIKDKTIKHVTVKIDTSTNKISSENNSTLNVNSELGNNERATKPTVVTEDTPTASTNEIINILDTMTVKEVIATPYVAPDSTEGATPIATPIDTQIAAKIATTEATKVAGKDTTPFPTSIATNVTTTVATSDATAVNAKVTTTIATPPAAKVPTTVVTRVTDKVAEPFSTSVAGKVTTTVATPIITPVATLVSKPVATNNTITETTNTSTNIETSQTKDNTQNSVSTKAENIISKSTTVENVQTEKVLPILITNNSNAKVTNATISESTSENVQTEALPITEVILTTALPREVTTIHTENVLKKELTTESPVVSTIVSTANIRDTKKPEKDGLKESVSASSKVDSDIKHIEKRETTTPHYYHVYEIVDTDDPFVMSPSKNSQPNFDKIPVHNYAPNIPNKKRQIIENLDENTTPYFKVEEQERNEEFQQRNKKESIDNFVPYIQSLKHQDNEYEDMKRNSLNLDLKEIIQSNEVNKKTDKEFIKNIYDIVEKFNKVRGMKKFDDHLIEMKFEKRKSILRFGDRKVKHLNRHFKDARTLLIKNKRFGIDKSRRFGTLATTTQKRKPSAKPCKTKNCKTTTRARFLPNTNEEAHPYYDKEDMQDQTLALQTMLHQFKQFGKNLSVSKEYGQHFVDSNRKGFDNKRKKKKPYDVDKIVDQVFAKTNDYLLGRADKRKKEMHAHKSRYKNYDRIIEMSKVIDAFTKEMENKNKKQNKRSASTEVNTYVNVLRDQIKEESKALKQYDWLATTVETQAALFKIKKLVKRSRKGLKIDPLDLQVLKYIIFLHNVASEIFKDKPKNNNLENKHITWNKNIRDSIEIVKEKSRFKNPWWFLRRHMPNNADKNALDKLEQFICDVEDQLFDLHNTIKSISQVTRYYNQNWFLNLKNLYLTLEKKKVHEILLHITFSRLIQLIEDSIKNLKEDFTVYMKKNTKEVKRTLDEMIFVLKVVNEGNKVNSITV
ncbi:uncharacterized protein LOC142984633 [Anticarsia gemmatalis]|uniref:uncharacterized protein LOC142984633 n=1 Tax=Anticarsia gemmatalis TaxID=129554 RepID=UPI003F771F48